VIHSGKKKKQKEDHIEILEVKHTITKTKHSVDGFNNRINEMEARTM